MIGPAALSVLQSDTGVGRLGQMEGPNQLDLLEPVFPEAGRQWLTFHYNFGNTSPGSILREWKS